MKKNQSAIGIYQHTKVYTIILHTKIKNARNMTLYFKHIVDNIIVILVNPRLCLTPYVIPIIFMIKFKHVL